MKKLIFILLTSMCALGQTSTGKEQKFPYGIRNMLPQTMTTATYLSTIGSDGTMGRILPSSLSNTFNPVISHLEYNNTDKTLWNNGKGNIDSNTSFGQASFISNTTGYQNDSFGNSALTNNTTGYNNVSIGSNSLSANNVGYNNTATGAQSLGFITNGYSNVGFGSDAGSITAFSDPNTSTGNCTFVGASTKPFGNADTNETVIGYNAVGHGSNTMTFGDTNILNNYFTGNVRANVFIKISGTSSQILMADGSVSTILSGSATLDFPSTLAGTSSELTITVSGAADGDVISLGIANASFNANSCYTARVSASNTVSVTFNNYSASPIDPSSATFKVKILK